MIQEKICDNFILTKLKNSFLIKSYCHKCSKLSVWLTLVGRNDVPGGADQATCLQVKFLRASL
jgi:hypothetical protein